MIDGIINGKEILITGGTGTLGKALIKELIKNYKPKGIRIFSRDELKQWELKKVLKDSAIPISFLLGDVRDLSRLKRAMNKVDIVFHTAALKHITACELDPFEAIKTNIEGTKNVIDSCIDCGVEKAILISTDKAVYPVNLYGATKMVAEKIWINSDIYTGSKGTKFSCCRYGNVLGSRGSVIPLFLEQKKSGEITLTDPDMTRFWITITDVAEFILKVSSIMEGGEIFIPKMPAMKLLDLALLIAPDSKIKVVGIRDAEKLHECLITSEESYNCEISELFYSIKKNYFNPVPFSYDSKTCPWSLNKESLFNLLKKEGFLIE